MLGMAVPGVSAARTAGMNPERVAQQYRGLTPGQRNASMERLNPQGRAEALSRMNGSQRAEAMYKMTPDQRAQTLGRMNPQIRNSLLAPQARMGQQSEQFRSSPSRGEQLSSRLAPALGFRGGNRDIPRAGNARTGNPGPLDPGGFIRRASAPSRNINPEFARRDFAQNMPNFNAVAAHNNANLIADRGAWPWHLPAYAPGWFNNWHGDWQYNNSGWQGPGFWNNYRGSLPWWGALAGLWPGGVNSDLGWVPYVNYYNGYNWDGNNYPCDYMADDGYCPTPYVFSVPNGQYWQVGRGYSNYLPAAYHAPITVAMQESVPEYDLGGQIVGYRLQTFYYNAFWDQQAQTYGYYDYRQQFHWVNAPSLNTQARYSY